MSTANTNYPVTKFSQRIKILRSWEVRIRVLAQHTQGPGSITPALYTDKKILKSLRLRNEA